MSQTKTEPSVTCLKKEEEKKKRRTQDLCFVTVEGGLPGGKFVVNKNL